MLDRGSVIALYAQVADALAEEIAAGHYRPGERIPGEHALMARFGCSRVTVRRAIAELLSRGVLVARQGKGTFVVTPPVSYPPHGLRGFLGALVAAGHQPETRLLDFAEAEPPASLRAKLRVRAGQPLTGCAASMPSAASRPR